MITDFLKLDVHRQSDYQTVYCKQYDNKTRELIISLYDKDTIVEMQENSIIMFRCKKPDGHQCLLNASYSEPNITVLLNENVLSEDGRCLCDIAVYNNIPNSSNLLFSSENFYLFVEKSSYDESKVVSSDEYSALTKATSSCQIETDRCETTTNNNITKYLVLESQVKTLIKQLEDKLASL